MFNKALGGELKQAQVICARLAHRHLWPEHMGKLVRSACRRTERHRQPHAVTLGHSCRLQQVIHCTPHQLACMQEVIKPAEPAVAPSAGLADAQQAAGRAAVLQVSLLLLTCKHQGWLWAFELQLHMQGHQTLWVVLPTVCEAADASASDACAGGLPGGSCLSGMPQGTACN